MKDFRDLKVWHKAHACTLMVYENTSVFPKEEQFGLTRQIRRAAGSVGMNIAEGCGRGSDADLDRFLQMAMGSASEVEYQLLLARDLGFLTLPDYDQMHSAVCEVKRMLVALIKSVRRPADR